MFVIMILEQFNGIYFMYIRFIAVTIGQPYGYYAYGDTIPESVTKLWKISKKKKLDAKKYRVWKFRSELPFAATSKRKADENEADCWIGQDGSISWVRCEREEVISGGDGLN